MLKARRTWAVCHCGPFAKEFRSGLETKMGEGKLLFSPGKGGSVCVGGEKTQNGSTLISVLQQSKLSRFC